MPKLYHIDAFTGELFAGNPAAVCLLDGSLATDTLQAIAAENSLPETAFLVGHGGSYQLRWFTPLTEVDLCGHATLASGWVIFNRIEPDREVVTFQTRSGPLMVRRAGPSGYSGEADLLEMDFPAMPATPVHDDATTALIDALGDEPSEILLARDYLAVYDCEEQVRALKPDLTALAEVKSFGVMVTAPGSEFDCVSRFFAPAQGVPEDPVTGSAHCTLAPYWCCRLGKETIRAFQASPRGGELECELRDSRVLIRGRCVPCLEGSISL